MATVYCFRSGQIRVSKINNEPEGSITLLRGPYQKLVRRIHQTARLAYDNWTYLVPGIPEADSDQSAEKALHEFSDRLRNKA